MPSYLAWLRRTPLISALALVLAPHLAFAAWPNEPGPAAPRRDPRWPAGSLGLGSRRRRRLFPHLDGPSRGELRHLRAASRRGRQCALAGNRRRRRHRIFRAGQSRAGARRRGRNHRGLGRWDRALRDLRAAPQRRRRRPVGRRWCPGCDPDQQPGPDVQHVLRWSGRSQFLLGIRIRLDRLRCLCAASLPLGSPAVGPRGCGCLQLRLESGNAGRRDRWGGRDVDALARQPHGELRHLCAACERGRIRSVRIRWHQPQDVHSRRHSGAARPRRSCRRRRTASPRLTRPGSTTPAHPRRTTGSPHSTSTATRGHRLCSCRRARRTSPTIFRTR